MKKTIIILVLIVAIVPLLVFLFTRTKKTTTNTPVKKTQTSKQIELTADEKPYISLIPRADGHELKFKVTNIPSKFSTAEYELIYTAEDEGLEIEKGVSGTVDLNASNFEWRLAKPITTLVGPSICCPFRSMVAIKLSIFLKSALSFLILFAY